ncbi:GAPR1 protein, partial [Atractosteus spatula]|nr:GAPR1 protein [Atractosteus spatula]
MSGARPAPGTRVCYRSAAHCCPLEPPPPDSYRVAAPAGLYHSLLACKRDTDTGPASLPLTDKQFKLRFTVVILTHSEHVSCCYLVFSWSSLAEAGKQANSPIPPPKTPNHSSKRPKLSDFSILNINVKDTLLPLPAVGCDVCAAPLRLRASHLCRVSPGGRKIPAALNVRADNGKKNIRQGCGVGWRLEEGYLLVQIRNGAPVVQRGRTTPIAARAHLPDSCLLQTNMVFRKTKGMADDKLSSFDKEFLDTHNDYRKKHGAPPLTLSRELSKTAQAWADHLLSIKTLQHSETENGENVYYAWSSAPKKLTGKEAVDSWYSEIKDYDFNNPGFQSNTGHFTQVVWKSSLEVGVGQATDGNTIFVVGQYSPAGNISNPGYFEKNVLPLGTPVSRRTTHKATKIPDLQNARGHICFKERVIGSIKQLRAQCEPVPEGQTPRVPTGMLCGNGSIQIQPPAYLIPSHSEIPKSQLSPLQFPPLAHIQEFSSFPRLCPAAPELLWARLVAPPHLLHARSRGGGGCHGVLAALIGVSCAVPAGDEAVESWYSEIKDYDFSRPGFSTNTGHFTQVVWRDSQELGIAKATDGKGMVFVVARYQPAGNITNAGYFEKNVLPPGAKPPEGASKGAGVKPQLQSRPGERNGQQADGSAPVHKQSGFDKEFLDTHNDYRKKHGAPPLTLSRELSKTAQAWADHLLSIKTLQHSKTENGENVYYAWSSAPKKLTGKEAVDSWYSEIKDYNFSRPGFQSNTGHFTQVVWKSSLEVGVGQATDGNTVFVVGQYSPAGNISNPGYFEKNVLPLGTPGAKPPEDASKGAGLKPQPGQRNGQQADGSAPDSFTRDILQACNEKRQAHGAPPLSLNSEMSRGAQSWAESLLATRVLKHSTTTYGENIWAKTGGPGITATGQEVVDSWYKEMDNYDFSRPGSQTKTGHFTQLVWRSSQELGVGLANSGTGSVIVVAQFQPAGNITNPGYYSRNVLPKGSKVTDKPREEDSGEKGAGRPVVTLPGHCMISHNCLNCLIDSNSDQSSQLSQFSQSLRETMNRFRQQHGAPPLQLSSALSKEALSWASHLVQSKALKSSGKDYGENLWYCLSSSTAPPAGSEVAESWYKESSKYNFGSPGFKSGTGNFSQMVWKSSREVGIGLATDGAGMFIAVVFFSPAGNITNKGYFEDNVKPKGTRI